MATRILLAGLVILMGLGQAQGVAPPVRLTDKQISLLKERDRLLRFAQRRVNAGKYAEAIPFGAKALELTRAVRGELHPEVLTALERLAALCDLAGDWSTAVKHRKAVLALEIRQDGPTHWRTADARLSLAFTRNSAALGSSARAEVLGALRQEVKVAQQQVEALESERILMEVAKAYRAHLGSVPAVARVLVAIGKRRAARGDLTGTRNVCEEALAIWQKTLPKIHPDTATAFYNLGLVQHHLGRDEEALKSIQEALDIRRKALPKGHPEIAITLNNLGSAQSTLGKHEEALKSQQEALNIFRKVLPKGHEGIALNLTSLGAVQSDLGKHEEALKSIQEAIDIYRKALPKRRLDIAKSLNNLGVVQHDLGKHEEALKSIQEAIDIYRKALPKGHPEIAITLNNRGGVQSALGKLEEALKSHQEGLDICRTGLPKGHPDVARSLHNLGLSSINAGKDSRLAREWLKEAAEINERHLSRLAIVQSETQQLRAAAAVRPSLDYFLSLVGDEQREESWALLVGYKGAVTARLRWARRSRTDDPSTARLLDELRRANLALLRSALDESFGRDRTERGGKDEPERLRQLSQRRDRLEEELAKTSPDYRRLLRQQRHTGSDIQTVLPAETTLIDFLEYRRLLPPTKGQTRSSIERRLLAFVVRPGKDKIALVRLGSAKRLWELIVEWRSSHGSGKKPAGKVDPAVALRQELWLPLEKHLGGAKVVLTSPDGVLNGLPLAALPGSKPGTFLVHEYAFAVVPVPQLLPELLAPRKHTGQPSLLLVGGIDFGKGKPATSALPAVHPLPGAEREVSLLRERFANAFPEAPVPRRLRSSAATRAAFLEAAAKARYLHVATHGFFAPQTERSALDVDARAALRREGLNAAVVGRHPGLLSGLVFAGVNDSKRPEESLLTALEASELNLEQAELVTLSACDTGLGRVAGGEGMLGLQRAFQLAGARSVLASLWKVPDGPTALLMREFYRRVWSGKPLARAEALRQAQLWMIERYDPARGGLALDELSRGWEKLPKGKKGPAPFYWAAFVLSGDWR
jgi:CHAT domain-containing protein/tetratricopeptide (TPR) repeat protein